MWVIWFSIGTAEVAKERLLVADKYFERVDNGEDLNLSQCTLSASFHKETDGVEPSDQIYNESADEISPPKAKKSKSTDHIEREESFTSERNVVSVSKCIDGDNINVDTSYRQSCIIVLFWKNHRR